MFSKHSRPTLISGANINYITPFGPITCNKSLSSENIFVYICEIKGVLFFAMTNNSSVLFYLFRAQISSNLLGIIYGKNQEPTPHKEQSEK
jgi:hypothetical protein